MKKFNCQNILLITVFAIILAIPTLDSIFGFSPVKDLFEKRQQLEKPQLPDNFSDFTKYPRQYEQYYNDNYGFRKTLISLHSKMMDKVFDESPNERVAIGKDGWLYFDNKNTLLDIQGRAQLGKEVVDQGVEAFAQNWKILKENKIDYLLVIAADKSTIYPEFLPDYIKPSNKNHRIDKFITSLKKKYPDFPIVYLRPTLLKAKENEIIYQKTDTHWNRRGAHYGYVQMMKRLNIKPHLRAEFTNKEDERTKGDISDMMGSKASNVNYDIVANYESLVTRRDITQAQQDAFHKPSSYINKNKKLPNLFTYHDSFFGDLFWLTSEHFANSFYINEYPCKINLAVIKEYNSNVVIHEFWEGRVQEVLKSCK